MQKEILLYTSRSNFWGNNYIEYKGYWDKNKIPTIKQNLRKSRPYLKDVIGKVKSLIHGKFN